METIDKQRLLLISAASELLEANVLFLRWYNLLVAGNVKKISVYRMERFANAARKAIVKATVTQ